MVRRGVGWEGVGGGGDVEGEVRGTVAVDGDGAGDVGKGDLRDGVSNEGIGLGRGVVGSAPGTAPPHPIASNANRSRKPDTANIRLIYPSSLPTEVGGWIF